MKDYVVSMGGSAHRPQAPNVEQAGLKKTKEGEKVDTVDLSRLKV